MLWGANPTEAHPIVGYKIRRALERGLKLVVVDPRKTELAALADLWLPLRPGTNVALANGIAHVILREGLYDEEFIRKRTENFEAYARYILTEWPLEKVERLTGIRREYIEQVARLYARAERALILWGLGVAEHRSGSYGVMSLANLALLCGHVGRPGTGAMPLRGQNNVQGACDMGALPYVLPGYQKPEDPLVRKKFEEIWGRPLPEKPGLTEPRMYQEALAGRFKALYVVGYDIAMTHGNLTMVHRALRNLELLVVHDIFFPRTGEFAHVVFPVACLFEKDGTTDNGERRVQRIRKLVDPPAGVPPDWWIIAEISRRLGYEMPYRSSRDIFEEMRRVIPAFAGITYERLEEKGLCWPVPDEDHPGTELMFTERFATASGKASFALPRYWPSEEEPGGDYPFLLITGRRLYHYNCGSMTRRIEGLMELVPEELVEMHPKDARRLKLRERDLVRIVSRRAAISARVHISSRVNPGILFMDFHFEEPLTNLVTSPGLDVKVHTPEYKVAAVRVEKV
ncbi:molybdopterin-dependent oxidoreductase [Thermosulfurimonas sp. F29]|nr:molybdopterin-dependent oxidoreductase [Thermosulfurimonas sp. F29]